MLDWIFEGTVDWIARITTKVMDAASGLFLNTLNADMTVMESYFPFIGKAFTVMQYMAWAILFLITIWQLFRAFGGPATEAENPTVLIMRAVLFAVLIWFAKPIFLYILEIARAPYTALMEIELGKESFTFAGIESVLRNGLVNLVSTISIVGALLVLILMISLGWNYFKLLLEVVERYVVVGILCYTSPLAYSMGASKATNQVFRSWCRMIGGQLLLLVMNVWFLRAFNSSVGQFVANGGALSNGRGTVFLWMFCAIAFLKTAQKFDSYLSAIGLNVAQTGSGMGMELLMAGRILAGIGSGFTKAGNMSSGGAMPNGGFMAGLANKFQGNSYVRDAVTQGGTRMGAGGPLGFFGRLFGGMAAKNGATLSGQSISSVANQMPNVSGRIGGDIANRSLANYLPSLQGKNLKDTQISGGEIHTNAVGMDGTETALDLYNVGQFEKPSCPHSIVTATDGSQWYQIASGVNVGEFYNMPTFTGDIGELSQVQELFPNVQEGTTLRSLDEGVMIATTQDGESYWYNSAYYNEPQAPHTVMQTSNGVDWYAMQASAQTPAFEGGIDAAEYDKALFQSFMPGYEEPISSVSGTQGNYGHFEVRHEDGSGTAFYDSTQFDRPRGDYQVYEDSQGGEWYAVHGNAAVERRPVYENGTPVYDDKGNVRTISVDTVRYSNTPNRYGEPQERDMSDVQTPHRKKI